MFIMARVVIDGQEFTLGSERVQDLMQWLQTNGGVRVESTQQGNFTGDQLLNETGKKPTPLNNQRPDGEGGTYDYGTTWI